MNVRHACAVAALAVAPLVSACESNKSANPLSPSVAGPIPGVEITAPKPLEPGAGSEVLDDKQPITLLLENAGTNGQRPLSYLVEVASDANFASKVFTKDGVAPGSNGRTSVRIPDKLQRDRTYFWRARAQDGANTGPFSAPVKFSIVTPSSLGAPTLVSPVNGAKQTDPTPQFRVRNASRAGEVGNVSYTLQVSSNESFTGLIAIWTFREQGGAGGESTFPAAAPLPYNVTIYWRVRGSDGITTGSWSATAYFKSADTPTDPGGGGGGGGDDGGGGGGGGGNPSTCASRDGTFIVECIADKYESYRRPGVSSGQRKANMEFLRNRIIEAGICGGLDLGWNRKRGGPDLSTDFIVDKRGAQEIGIDIARDYDNRGKWLQLTWASDGPGSHYKRYTPRPNCN
jgi:hypothetical protein